MTRPPSKPDIDAGREPYFIRRQYLDEAGHLVLRKSRGGEVSLFEHRRDRPGLTTCTSNTPSESYLVVVNLRPLGAHYVLHDRKRIPRRSLQRGSLALFDLRDIWGAELDQPFHTLNFLAAQAAFDELFGEYRVRGLKRLSLESFYQDRDDVMLDLALAVSPALRKPWEINRLIADYIFRAMTTHLAQTYGGIDFSSSRHTGGLSPARERLVKDMMLADLAGEFTLRELAEACGLSDAHFSREFRQTTGKPPHRWLLEQRVERAKDLLAYTERNISEIALACGFADQSHLTRVFSRATGLTPGAWRRARKS